MVSFAENATNRLNAEFRQATLRNYTRMFKGFWALLVKYNIFISQVTTITLLCYMECLFKNNMFQSNKTSNLAGCRAMHIFYSLPTLAFQDQRLPLYPKSSRIYALHVPHIKPVVTTDILHKLIESCKVFDIQEIYRALYLFAFYSVRHLSNILPHSISRI